MKKWNNNNNNKKTSVSTANCAPANYAALIHKFITEQCYQTHTFFSTQKAEEKNKSVVTGSMCRELKKKVKSCQMFIY